MSTQPTRRDFLKSSVVAGITVYIAAPGNTALAALLEKERLRPLPWDAKTGRHARSLSAAGLSGALAMSKDGRKLLIAAQDGLSLWDTETMDTSVLFIVPEHRFSHAVALSPDNRWAVLGRGGYNNPGQGWVRADDPRVPVWDLGVKK